MFQWFSQMSVIARLRSLALLAFVAMLALSSSLLWSAYKQRLADRQAAASQGIELAHASVQWAYAKQQFGKLNPAQARQQTLAALERVKQGRTITRDTDVHSTMLLQTVLTLMAVVVISVVLWACIEVIARDMARAAEARRRASDHRAAPGSFSRGPQAYRQSAGTPEARPAAEGAAALSERMAPAAQTEAISPTDPEEAAAQEVRRLRMFGAI